VHHRAPPALGSGLFKTQTAWSVVSGMGDVARGGGLHAPKHAVPARPSAGTSGERSPRQAAPRAAAAPCPPAPRPPSPPPHPAPAPLRCAPPPPPRTAPQTPQTAPLPPRPARQRGRPAWRTRGRGRRLAGAVPAAPPPAAAGPGFGARAGRERGSGAGYDRQPGRAACAAGSYWRVNGAGRAATRLQGQPGQRGHVPLKASGQRPLSPLVRPHLMLQLRTRRLRRVRPRLRCGALLLQRSALRLEHLTRWRGWRAPRRVRAQVRHGARTLEVARAKL
jgi:hypothetical protein